MHTNTNNDRKTYLISVWIQYCEGSWPYTKS